MDEAKRTLDRRAQSKPFFVRWRAEDGGQGSGALGEAKRSDAHGSVGPISEADATLVALAGRPLPYSSPRTHRHRRRDRHVDAVDSFWEPSLCGRHDDPW